MGQIKILVAGGGVAGTAIAFWLTKLGHDVTVVEWYPSLRTTGLQIDLRGPGIEVMRRMGLEKGFRAKAAPEEGMQLVDSAGRDRAYFPATKSGDGAQSMTSEFEIMRGDFCRLMHDATEDKARYIFGTSVESYVEDDDGVDVLFKNGSRENFDLVVGADGVWSSTRKLMLGKEAAAKTWSSINEYWAYMTIKRKAEEGERYIGRMYLATEKRSFLVRRHSPEEIQLYLLLNRADDRIKNTKRGDIEAEKAAFAEIYEGAGWRTPEYLKEMQYANDFYCERLGVVKMDSWSKGRVTLVGDAGYAAGGSGVGSTVAIVGAYVLAGEISKHCGAPALKENGSSGQGRAGIDAALQAYDTQLRPFIVDTQKGLGESSNWFMPSTKFGLFVFHLVASTLAFIRIDLVVSFFLKESANGWKIPEYETMPNLKPDKAA